MKHIQIFVFTVFAVASMLVNSAAAQSVKGTATVVRIKGEARYSLGDNVWHPLVAGKTLGAGAVIQTAVDSTVDLVLGQVPVQVAYPNSSSLAPAGLSQAPDPNVRGYVVYNAKVNQNVIRMFGNTVLAIDALTVSNTGADVVGDTELDLRAGKIFGTVKKESAMSKFEIKIPNGIAGIRGTTFTIDASGNVTVTEGEVLVSYNGTVYQVGQGQTFNPLSGPGSGVQPATQSLIDEVKSTYTDACTSKGAGAYYVDNLAEIYCSPIHGSL